MDKQLKIIIELISDTFDITLDEATNRFDAWIEQSEYPNLFNDFISFYDEEDYDEEDDIEE
jgi:hypothetical protein